MENIYFLEQNKFYFIFFYRRDWSCYGFYQHIGPCHHVLLLFPGSSRASSPKVSLVETIHHANTNSKFPWFSAEHNTKSLDLQVSFGPTYDRIYYWIFHSFLLMSTQNFLK